MGSISPPPSSISPSKLLPPIIPPPGPITEREWNLQLIKNIAKLLKNTVVTWLGYCRYSVKQLTINQPLIKISQLKEMLIEIYYIYIIYTTSLEK